MASSHCSIAALTLLVVACVCCSSPKRPLLPIPTIALLVMLCPITRVGVWRSPGTRGRRGSWHRSTPHEALSSNRATTHLVLGSLPHCWVFRDHRLDNNL